MIHIIKVFFGIYIFGVFIINDFIFRLIWTLIPLLGMFGWWVKKGRDYRYESDQIYYTPDKATERKVGIFERSHLPLVYTAIKDLTPSEVAVFYDDRVHFRDMMAEIVDLVRIGFLQIVKVDGDYLLIKKDKSDKELRPYQKYLMNSLFMVGMYSPGPTFLEKYYGNLNEAIKMSKKCVVMSKMKRELKSFYGTYSALVYRWMTERGWYDITWEDLKYLFGVSIGVLVLVPIFLWHLEINWPWIIMVVGVLMVCCLFLFFMPAKTAEGYRYFWQVKGLKYYLEKGKWRHEVAEKNLFFEEIFPLAMVLGVVNTLAEEMVSVGKENINMELYRWYMMSN